MTALQDGRGELLPLPWWGRILRWIKDHPWVVFVAGLIGTAGVAGARARYYRAKAAGAQTAADVATTKASRAERVVLERQAAAGAAVADGQATQAKAEDRAAGGDAAKAHETLEEIARKWPVKCLIFACFLWASVGVAGAEDVTQAQMPAENATQAKPCPPDTPTGLPAVLDALAGRLKGLDAEAVNDAATSLRARADERAAMCAQLDARGREVAALEAGRASRERELVLMGEDRDHAWAAWEAAMLKPQPRGRGPLGWTAGAGACRPSGSELDVCVAVVWGWRF